MSDIRFYLKNRYKPQSLRNKDKGKELSDNPTSVIAKVFISGKVFKYGIGKTIYPKLWDETKQRPIRTRSKIKPYQKKNPHIDIDLENVKTRIENIERDIKKEIESFEKRNEIVDLVKLRKFLDSNYRIVVNVSKNANKDQPETLNEYIQRFITEIETGQRTYTNPKGEMRKYSHGTVKTYKGFQVQLNEYQKKKRTTLDFNDITLDLYYKLVQYFSNKDYSTNSIGKLVKTLKTIMAASREEKLHSNTEYLSKNFKTLKVDVVNVYLTQKEVDTLYRLDFGKFPAKDLDPKLIPAYELTRDVFLCGVWTAQRFSDYSRIKKNHIKERDGKLYFEMITKKTSQSVTVPLRPELDTILKRYNYQLPKTYEQKINVNIKEICRLAKITEPIEVEKIKRGLKVINTIPKYKMVKTHTARRTAITLMYLANISITDIQKISGHSTEKHLRNYIKITKEETATRLSINPYFTGGVTLKKA